MKRLSVPGIALLTHFALTVLHQSRDGAVAKDAVAVIQSARGSRVHGVVPFTQTERSVKVIAHITGLEAGSKAAVFAHPNLTAAYA